MLIKKSTRISSTEITPESVYRSRRDFIGKSAALIAGAGLLGRANAGLQPDDELTPEEIVTQYNNFYEFGTDKGDPVKHAGALTTDPWTVTVSGAANKTGEFAYEEVVKGLVAEERVYRFRCVEAWSMVVPWLGIPLVDIL